MHRHLINFITSIGVMTSPGYLGPPIYDSPISSLRPYEMSYGYVQRPYYNPMVTMEYATPCNPGTIYNGYVVPYNPYLSVEQCELNMPEGVYRWTEIWDNHAHTMLERE